MTGGIIGLSGLFIVGFLLFAAHTYYHSVRKERKNSEERKTGTSIISTIIGVIVATKAMDAWKDSHENRNEKNRLGNTEGGSYNDFYDPYDPSATYNSTNPYDKGRSVYDDLHMS